MGQCHAAGFVSYFSRYLVLDIADSPVENIIRYFPMVCLSDRIDIVLHIGLC